MENKLPQLKSINDFTNNPNDYLAEYKRADHFGNALFLYQGRILEELYKLLKDKFQNFIKENEISYKTAMEKMRMWRVFGELENPPAFRRLQKIAPLVQKNPEQKQDWLDNAILLRDEDFNNAVKEAKGLPTTDTCNHEEIKVIYKCNTCNKVLKICQATSEQIPTE